MGSSQWLSQIAMIMIKFQFEFQCHLHMTYFLGRMWIFVNIFSQDGLRENGTICCAEQTETDIGN